MKVNIFYQKADYRSVLRVFVIFMIFVASVDITNGQFRKSGSNTFTYEEIYDTPYEIHKLFLMIQPLYGELFVANVNVGFGIEAQYYLKDKLDFRAHGRKTYTKKFDHSRDIAEKNSNVDNIPNVYNYFELGATYHVVDKEDDTETRMVLYSKRYKGRKWVAKVPDHAVIPSKVRKIYGVRLGGMAYDTSTDLDRALEKQSVTLVDESGVPINGDAVIFGNLSAKGIYVGGSSAWIKNFAVKPEKTYSDLTSDLIFTTYLDIIIAPSITVDDVRYNGSVYDTDVLKTNILGVRGGMEGKFNRDFSWAYGAEIGFRPGIKNRGFYALFKISFPVIGTSLNHSKEAFGK
ncbi:hypothetical protein QQ020_08560 [Fulvivirgaceae bacterium BMA12]|uniref:Bacterial surface antigen (D15) domain-containing protein n=1 Tax=Agaribacillus aureus TaxID=3051825 RepID=A0ABT8L4C4_9BACT|nr:hypothetical protein [Fulvivirgaceae bacterium BMA12]